MCTLEWYEPKQSNMCTLERYEPKHSNMCTLEWYEPKQSNMYTLEWYERDENVNIFEYFFNVNIVGGTVIGLNLFSTITFL